MGLDQKITSDRLKLFILWGIFKEIVSHYSTLLFLRQLAENSPQEKKYCRKKITPFFLISARWRIKEIKCFRTIE